MDPNPLLVALHKVRTDFPIELATHIYELIFVCLAYAGGYVYRLGKNWYQRGNTKEKQTALCLEAERLLKLRATLAAASDPAPRVSSAQAAIGNQLNQVLDRLSHLLTEPEASTHNSRAVEVIGKYLLLYRSAGIVSVVMHWIFYFLVLVWGLFVSIGLSTPPHNFGVDITVSGVLLIPVVAWNYITRKVDSWMRSRSAATPATVTVSPKEPAA
jgi:hypothetical protein